MIAAIAPSAAQSIQTIPLATPDAMASEPFTLIRGARELPDGRLIVSDWIEQRLAVIDFERGTVTDRGRVGAGPLEFRLPGALLRFRGDSTILIDVGNDRLAVLDGEGRPVRSFVVSAGGARQPSAAASDGRLYFTIPRWLAKQELPGDSVELVVWDPATDRAEVVTRVHGSTPPPNAHYSPEPRIPFVVFAAQDAWTVTASGKLAIVRDRDYRVEWFDGDRIVRGPAYAGRPVPVSAADRTGFVRQFLESSAVSGRGEDGGLGHVPADERSDESIKRMVRASTFAHSFPHFRAGDARIDGASRLWISIWSRTGEPRRYDVFDTDGRRLASVVLRPGRQIIALGNAHAYAVHTSENGLQSVERYRIPPLPLRNSS